jgi:hypothetical protein
VPRSPTSHMSCGAYTLSITAVVVKGSSFFHRLSKVSHLLLSVIAILAFAGCSSQRFGGTVVYESVVITRSRMPRMRPMPDPEFYRQEFERRLEEQNRQMEEQFERWNDSRRRSFAEVPPPFQIAPPGPRGYVPPEFSDSTQERSQRTACCGGNEDYNDQRRETRSLATTPPAQIIFITVEKPPPPPVATVSIPTPSPQPETGKNLVLVAIIAGVATIVGAFVAGKYLVRAALINRNGIIEAAHIQAGAKTQQTREEKIKVVNFS